MGSNADTTKTTVSRDLPGENSPTHSAQIQTVNREVVNRHGFRIVIENRKNTIRSGEGQNGNCWEVKMPADYGFIVKTSGADGDGIDVYLGENPHSAQVYIINQQTLDGEFDEHKCMLGFDSQTDAAKTYCAGFSDGNGPRRMQSILHIHLKDFHDWVQIGNTQEPFTPTDVMKEELQGQYKIFCDMDGVLVNFEKGLESITGYSSYDKAAKEIGTDAIWAAAKAAGSEWWENLEWLEGGQDLWNYLQNNFKYIQILTAAAKPKLGDVGAIGKEHWCQKHLGIEAKDVITCNLSQDKKHYAEADAILIDDMPENIAAWRKAGGIGILHKDTPSTIAKLSSYLLVKDSNAQLEEDWKSVVAAGLIGLSGMVSPTVSYAKAPSRPIHKIMDFTQAENINIMAATLIGEAGGEGAEGMQAVANVIMNRAGGDFKKVGAVCLQPYQFSMWNKKQKQVETVVASAQKHPRWSIAVNLVQKAMSATLPDVTGGATFYFNPKLAMPSWAEKFNKTDRIGNHVFYKHVGNVARFY
jgi:hypothetical protein